jgi:hypothetical protein
VIVQHKTGEIRPVLVESVLPDAHIAWQELPEIEPYVPPQPKRRSGTTYYDKAGDFTCDIDGTHMGPPATHWDFRQVLPGDPDPDVVLDVLESMRVVYGHYPTMTCIATWIKQIEESRSK